MEKRPPLPMTQLDMLVTSEKLQMMKLMLPYIPSSYRGMLAIYLKFTEFQNTLRLFNGSGSSSSSDIIKSRDIHSPADILEDLRPFMDPKDMDSIDMLLNAINMMDMMKGMLTPEQQGMFDMYSTMFNEMESQDSDMKGDDDNNG